MLVAQLFVEGKHSSSERVAKDASHFPRVASLVTSRKGKYPENDYVLEMTLTLSYKHLLTSHCLLKTTTPSIFPR
jgi:hypothetical protein